MKSISRIALVFILTLCFVGVCIPAAQAFETVSFETTVVMNAKSGETYDMSVAISENSNAHIIELSLYYDPTLVSISDLRSGSITEGIGGLVLLEDHKESNRIIFSILMPRDPFMGEGALFTFKATLLREQNAEFRLDVSGLINMPINGEATDIPISAASGGLFVGTSAPGITPIVNTPSPTSQVNPTATPATATSAPAPDDSGDPTDPADPADPDATHAPDDPGATPYAPDGSAGNDGNADGDANGDGDGDPTQDDAPASTDQRTEAEGADQSIDEAEPKPASDLSWLIYVGIGVLVLALVGLFIVKNKNK